MEHTFTCNACHCSEGWTSSEAAQAAAVWHVYEDHPKLWLELAGDRPPVDPRPETLGRQFQTWER